LAASHRCEHLTVISTYPLPPIAKVTTVHPPAWLLRMLSTTLARLLVFAWTALWRRPDIVGGFHIKVNALVAAVLAPLIGARAVYFCVGGESEVLGGNCTAEGGVWRKMETPDMVVERRLLRGVDACDLIITMGTRAATFFRSKGVRGCTHVVPGAIDMVRFRPGGPNPSVDLMFVGRLVEIKRLDLFLEVVACVARRLSGVTVSIVGDGPLRQALERQARDLGIGRHVTFLGFAPDVSDCLRQARIFVLTSRSEGLALSLMEAMACGLPAVVADVGDLGDLVEDGVNGYLVTERTAEAFASRIVDLLTDSAKYTAFSLAARRSAQRYETAAAVKQWDELLSSLNGDAAKVSTQEHAVRRAENV
jgi:glycosyltransferase involved in cell wall biosynthesis